MKNKKRDSRFKKNIRGDLTTEQIVILIVLIVSFIVILFFIFKLNLGKTTEQENCHNSVLERSAGVLPKESIPLNCKTQYICISRDGTCEKTISPQIEKVSSKNETYQVLAQQMADCWWMFGEGKLNYLGEGLSQSLYCSICSQISFDNSVNFFPNNQINKNDFYNYLAKTNASGKDITYLEYLTEIKDSAAYSNTNLGQIDLSKQYLVVMGEYNKVSLAVWIATGALVGAGAITLAVLTAGASIPVTVSIIGGAAGGGLAGNYVGTAVQGASGLTYFSPQIIEANSASFDSLQCKSIKTIG